MHLLSIADIFFHINRHGSKVEILRAHHESSWSSSAILPTVLFLRVVPNLFIDDPMDEKPLLRSEKPLERALEVVDPEPRLAALPPPPPPPPPFVGSKAPPTVRNPLVKAEVDLEKAESKTLPDLLVNSLAESRGFVTAEAKVFLDRAEGKGKRIR